MDLHGKVAVVTGAGRGLGREYAQRLADAGAAVVVNDLDRTDTDATVELITAAGGTAVGCATAVGSTAAAELLVDTAVDRFGGLDVMVANAGILRDRVLWKMTDDDFDQVVEVHLRGTFTCARAAAIRMRDQGGGRIICVGSPTGQHGTFGQTNYAAAKAGIVGMVRTWALELARQRITVNAVVPVAATQMTATIPALRPYVDALTEGLPLPAFARRELGFGTPADVSGLIVFLASDEAQGVTGQAIGIGGDRLALWTHPSEFAVQYQEGGWSPTRIAEVWEQYFAEHLQTVGPNFPEPVS
ncbi:SDR family NAD(P)-dependent oxidoreductase [Yinghuangia sp. YIM S09857]|uniref:SDR family NAD(P)-dependent oxidoreductase n=1 Tax=Yinghuangia sp. YIM S09857 TaxID=3436929 RepID=UPI003F52E610